MNGICVNCAQEVVLIGEKSVCLHRRSGQDLCRPADLRAQGIDPEETTYYACPTPPNDDVEQQEYVISADVWGKVGCTVRASSQDEALELGERILRANWRANFELFPPAEGIEVEAFLDVDTDFDIEVEEEIVADTESDVYRMAKAYAQEVHGLDPQQLSINEWGRAITVAQRMKEAADE